MHEILKNDDVNVNDINGEFFCDESGAVCVFFILITEGELFGANINSFSGYCIERFLLCS